MRLTNTSHNTPSNRHQPVETLLSPLFFVQTRPADQAGLWHHLYPLHRVYGYATIEAAETAITELEQQDVEWELSFEYRIKEELV